MTLKLWSREEEKQLIYHIKNYNGDMTKVAQELGRSVRAVDIRTTKVMQELKTDRTITTFDIVKLFGNVFSEEQVKQRLRVDMKTIGSNDDSILKTLDEKLDMLSRRLVKIEKMLKKKFE